MRSRRRRPRADEETGGIGWAVVLGCVVALFLTSAVAVVSAARTIEIGPRVGDILGPVDKPVLSSAQPKRLGWRDTHVATGVRG